MPPASRTTAKYLISVAQRGQPDRRTQSPMTVRQIRLVATDWRNLQCVVRSGEPAGVRFKYSREGPLVNEPGKLGLAILAGAVIVTGSLVSGQSAHGSSPAPRLNSVAAWQSAVGGVSSPGRGCFRASYPNLQWHATTCTTVAQPACAPATQTRRVKPATPNTVGNGYDYSAQVAGTIFQATGSFTNVSSTISE
jgi:hypothetical protein